MKAGSFYFSRVTGVEIFHVIDLEILHVTGVDRSHVVDLEILHVVEVDPTT